jgi:hypothetical protein
MWDGSRYSSRDLKTSRGKELWIWGYRRDTMNQTMAVYRNDIYSFPCATNLFRDKEICLIALIWTHCVSLGTDLIQGSNVCRQKWTIPILRTVFFSVITQRVVITTICCVTALKCAVLIYFAAEAWNHVCPILLLLLLLLVVLYLRK